MNDSDKKRFAEVWTSAHMATVRKAPDSATLRMVFAVLADYSIEEVSSAVHRHLLDPDTGMFPPKPADVVRHIDGGASSRESQALVAWRKLVDNYGYYFTVCFDDPHIHRVVQALGGWKGLNEKLVESEMKWVQREFEKLYLGLPRSGAYPKQLTGHVDSHNSALPGYTGGEPMFIGDEAAAREVYAGGGHEQLTDARSGLRPITAFLGVDQS